MAASAPPAGTRTPLTSAGCSCAPLRAWAGARRLAAFTRPAAPGLSSAGQPLPRPGPRPDPGSWPPGELAAAPSLRPQPGPPRQPRLRAAPPRRGPAPSPPPPRVSRGSSVGGGCLVPTWVASSSPERWVPTTRVLQHPPPYTHTHRCPAPPLSQGSPPRCLFPPPPRIEGPHYVVSSHHRSQPLSSAWGPHTRGHLPLHQCLRSLL